MKKKTVGISKEILSAHERIASEYGLDKPLKKEEICGYDNWNLKHNVVGPLKKIINEIFFSDSPVHVLDAGCGNGQISQILCSIIKCKIVGLDFSRRMLIYAKKRFDLLNRSNDFFPILADLGKTLPLRQSTFDLVIFFGVLEHLDAADSVIHRILKEVKPGGYIIIALPRKWSLAYLTYILFGESPKYWGSNRKYWKTIFKYKEKLSYYKFYTPKFLSDIILNENGFLVTRKVGFAYFHLDGIPGKILHYLGKKGEKGRKILLLLDKIAQKCHLIPAGEYWVIKREKL